MRFFWTDDFRFICGGQFVLKGCVFLKVSLSNLCAIVESSSDYFIHVWFISNNVGIMLGSSSNNVRLMLGSFPSQILIGRVGGIFLLKTIHSPLDPSWWGGWVGIWILKIPLRFCLGGGGVEMPPCPLIFCAHKQCDHTGKPPEMEAPPIR